MTGGSGRGLKYLGSKKSFWGRDKGHLSSFLGGFRLSGLSWAWGRAFGLGWPFAGCWGSCGLCRRSRTRRTCTLLFEVYPAGMNAICGRFCSHEGVKGLTYQEETYFQKRDRTKLQKLNIKSPTVYLTICHKLFALLKFRSAFSRTYS